MRVVRVAVLAVLGAAAALVAVAPSSVAVPARSPAVTGQSITPASGPPTSAITITDSGFGAREAVDVFAGTADVALAVSDESGNVSVATQVPATAQPGSFVFTLVGRHSGTATQLTFTVRTPIPQAGVTATHSSWNRFENTITPSTVNDLDLAWSRSLGMTSSPAVAGGYLYVSSNSGAVYKIKAATGATVWSEVFGTAPTGTPAVSGSTVVVTLASGTVVGLNATTGAPRWSYQPPTSSAPAGPPTVTSTGAYIVYTNGQVAALSMATGAQLWLATMNGTGANSAAVSLAAGLVITDLTVDGVYAWQLSTGTQVWFAGTGKGQSQPPVIVGNRVVLFTGASLIYQFGLTSGALFHISSTESSGTAAAVGNGIAYVTDADGVLAAIRLSDGTTIWQTSSTSYTGTPFLAGGVLWVAYLHGPVWAVDPSTGAQLTAVAATTPQSPVVADGQLYVDSAGILDALAPPTAGTA